ncbi:hypothetical protein HII31_09803 [Pseudocercospora fuligena]|uniref:Secreted protein n=1 Tax=Pseudocercospora fuligena TaxID=685502 RepID=A0A8H6RBN2_9PEZI|nr:hypothetical protein HII31_09803 [Pseudocercospora fuligena]
MSDSHSYTPRLLLSLCSFVPLILGRVRPVPRSPMLSSAALPFQVTASVTKSRKVLLTSAVCASRRSPHHCGCVGSFLDPPTDNAPSFSSIVLIRTRSTGRPRQSVAIHQEAQHSGLTFTKSPRISFRLDPIPEHCPSPS